MSFYTIDPRTNEKITEYSYQTYGEILQLIEKGHETYKEWRKTPLIERKKKMYILSELLEKNAEEYGALITKEMGKHLSESIAEIKKCSLLAKVTADKIDEWLMPEHIKVDGKKHLISFEPIGITFSIMPWNFPFWQVLRAAIPTILAGNVTLLKHAESTTGCGRLIEEIFKEASFPEGVLQNVITTHEVAEEIIAHPWIRAISFTGSDRGGREIATCAGKNLKKCILELGGSDPFIVLPDADLEKTIKGAVLGRFMNAGQVCISSKRFIVHKDIAEEFTRRFKEAVSKIEIAPLVNERAAMMIEAQVEDARQLGATVVCGGKRKDGCGNFYEPTIITNITPEMRVVREEVFGPVAPIIVVSSEEEAIQIANDTEFGLGGSIWSENLNEAEKLSYGLECGAIFINSIVKSDPLMPFGGVKNSGFGVELSKYGLYEMLNIKGINIYE